jgi:predicted alpha-1,6-mannanase (GH76 family)
VYLSWAKREWSWFSHSGMINDKRLVNDGLNNTCKNNAKTTWSYNQGVILGGLSALYRVDHDSSLLHEAHGIAEAAIAGLGDAQGILHDDCEPKCGADGTQFKGIFVRNLRVLDEVDPRPGYGRFVLANAASIWGQTGPPEYHLGEVWNAGSGTADASSQSSALDVLVSAAWLSKGLHTSAPAVHSNQYGFRSR